ncbi:MAG: hypothetical protein IKP72_04505 [Clostridia bacterium]|nr:hypothetical protein [Clostridia bacterium]
MLAGGAEEKLIITLGKPLFAAQRAVSPDPQPQSSQLPFMGRLLISADLTADEIPATGGHRRFVPSEKGDKRLFGETALFLLWNLCFFVLFY